MEIPKSWFIQDAVGQQPVGSEFGAREITDRIGNTSGVPAFLSRMECVEKTDVVGKIGFFGRSPNIYKRQHPSRKICANCAFGRSGSSGCVIQFPEMPSQLGLKLDSSNAPLEANLLSFPSESV